MLGWRTERDSNPRTAFTVTHFPGVRLQPLGHLSSPECAEIYWPEAGRKHIEKLEIGLVSGAFPRRLALGSARSPLKLILWINLSGCAGRGSPTRPPVLTRTRVNIPPGGFSQAPPKPLEPI